MQLEVIGVGGAGCRIADAILAAEPADHRFVGDAFAFDTDTDGLAALEAIPESNRHRYGETIRNGLNGNLQRGFEVGDASVDELSRHLDDGRPSIADAFLVVLGLGGATGGGTAPELVATLRAVYDKPVYVLATVPAERELEPPEDPLVEGVVPESEAGTEDADEPEDTDDHTRPLAEENAARTLERLDGLASAVLCFDNEAWLRTGERLAEGRDRLNRDLATRVAAFFSAGAASESDGEVAETVIDASDVARVLDGGEDTLVATLGYGEQEVESDDGGSRFGLGLFSTESNVDTASAVSAVETTISKALNGKLTLECDRENADATMVIVGGPPAWLNRTAISDGRRTVQSRTGSRELLGGDAPRPNGDRVFATILFAGVEPVERLEAIRETAR
ncbi:Cell division GTPase FtsZ [Halobiforma haloterrestris]|uniref:Tubulin-like protein CetZ n=1 Tax=Natronobacterium haloterrestre TaxID=148448 RepID=A0A1I1GUC9_NATHA|nr:tubulin/FtsZ family protein [Halobiforma haloterrestris]SFC15397.1 Cell division GTPase FtsZ [Halobiforma haloterrestris]